MAVEPVFTPRSDCLATALTMRATSIVPTLLALVFLWIATSVYDGSDRASTFVHGAPTASSDKTGAALISTNFDATVAKGMWLVEYFSPYCGHCKAFAPTWSVLVDMHEHLAESSNFRFGRVDCIAQGDLCISHDIKGYPSMFLYADGKKVKEYSGDRSYELLSTFILTNAKSYREQQAA